MDFWKSIKGGTPPKSAPVLVHQNYLTNPTQHKQIWQKPFMRKKRTKQEGNYTKSELVSLQITERVSSNKKENAWKESNGQWCFYENRFDVLENSATENKQTKEHSQKFQFRQIRKQTRSDWDSKLRLHYRKRISTSKTNKKDRKDRKVP